MTTSMKIVGLLVVLVCLTATIDAALFTSTSCKWHGSAPFCMASCPSDKKEIIGTASKCGPNKLACCLSGQKKVCCPKTMTIDAAMAIAIAKD